MGKARRVSAAAYLMNNGETRSQRGLHRGSGGGGEEGQIGAEDGRISQEILSAKCGWEKEEEKWWRKDERRVQAAREGRRRTRQSVLSGPFRRAGPAQLALVQCAASFLASHAKNEERTANEATVSVRHYELLGW